MYVITLIASINNSHYVGFHGRDTRLHAQRVRQDAPPLNIVVHVQLHATVSSMWQQVEVAARLPNGSHMYTRDRNNMALLEAVRGIACQQLTDTR